jgi:hypothetical protein
MQPCATLQCNEIDVHPSDLPLSRDFRNSYLASGGHDPSLLAHYTDTEYRLRAYEDYPWTKDYPETLKANRRLY